MKIQIIKVGKPSSSEVRTLAQMYVTRLQPLAQVEMEEWKEADLEDRASRRVSLFQPGKLVVALDERGKQYASKSFALIIQKWMDDPSVKQVIFLIGGPYGLGDNIRKEAKALWSLSEGTLPSDLAWVVACEQIYRAFTILKGMPYHHAG
jgi:23S rRNA (pseudouridine1915-N3)-methyltransferase